MIIYYLPQSIIKPHSHQDNNNYYTMEHYQEDSEPLSERFLCVSSIEFGHLFLLYILKQPPDIILVNNSIL